MDNDQIREFLYRLAGSEGCQWKWNEWRCGGSEFTHTKKILDLMKIPAEEQNDFIERCHKHDGHCDYEILMNAAPFLLGEDTPW